MSYETILFEVSDHKAVLTLNRPESYNAFDHRMQDEVRHVWERVKEDSDIRVVILTGAGDKAFCTGADRKQSTGPRTFERELFHREDPSLWLSPKANRVWTPVICAVNGMCCGGGFYFLGESDFVIAADHATFFDPHVTYGITAVLEPVMLSRRMPLGDVLRMALLGNDERISAERAREIGLVSEVVPADDLMEAADWAASRIAEKDPIAVQGTVRGIWASLEMHRSIAMDVGFHLAVHGNDHADQAAATDAFLSKDRPSFRTR